MYVCPKCKEKLVLNDRTYKCSNNHSYDKAKEGYVNLLLKNSKNHGDNKDMVLARRHFLEHDYYKVMANELIKFIEALPHDTLIDLGCGEGRDAIYLLDQGYNISALDYSVSVINISNPCKTKIGYANA